MSIWPTLLVVLACVRPPPPGPSPAERLEQVPPPLRVEAQLPEVLVALTLRAGSAMDPSGQEGLGWLTAWSLRSGGTTTRSPAEVEAALAALEARLEVRVERELVHFIGRAPAQHHAALLALLGELLTQPGWDPAAVAATRQQAIAALEALPQDPQALAEALLEGWMYTAHPYAHPPQGRLGVLPHLGVEQAQAHHRRLYTRAAAHLGVLGPAEPGAVDALVQALETLPAQAVAPRTPRPFPAVEDRAALLVQAEVDGVVVALGRPLRADQEDPALALRGALPAALTALGAPAPLTLVEGCSPGAARVQPCVGLRAGPWPEDQAPQALGQLLRAVAALPDQLPPAAGPLEAQALLLRALADRALQVPNHPPTPALPPEAPVPALWDAGRLRVVLVCPDPAGLGARLGEDSGPDPVQADDPAAAGEGDLRYAGGIDRWSILPTEGLFR